jgi:hypothetical protein
MLDVLMLLYDLVVCVCSGAVVENKSIRLRDYNASCLRKLKSANHIHYGDF